MVGLNSTMDETMQMGNRKQRYSLRLELHQRLFAAV